MTRHALLARPLWDCAESVPAVNTVFYAGASDLQAAVERVGSPLGLTVDNTKRIQQYGQVRWDSLRACHVAVFDLRGAGAMSSLVTSDPRRARELAGAAYELGLAFALGSPVVVVTAAGDRLPFDVDVAPVEMEGDEAPDGAMLTQAIDEAFYVPQRRGSRSSIGDTLAALDTLTRPHERRAAIEGMGWVSASLAGDPAGFGAACDQVFRLLPGSGWALLRPSWPGAYASEDRRQCFHVMPFGPAWADGVRDAVREVCGSLGLAYRRGDEAEEGRIIHAIWDDICRAQVVVVDLTGANLNVLIELGIAHATGRPVIAVEQRELPGARPKNIEKFRVLAYDSPDTLAAVLRGRIPGVLTPT